MLYAYLAKSPKADCMAGQFDLREYDDARKAFEYLESRAELVDQVELDSERLYLMRNPTRGHAAGLYRTAIRLWFQEHDGKFDGDERVIAIREALLDYC